MSKNGHTACGISFLLSDHPLTVYYFYCCKHRSLCIVSLIFQMDKHACISLEVYTASVLRLCDSIVTANQLCRGLDWVYIVFRSCIGELITIHIVVYLMTLLHPSWKWLQMACGLLLYLTPCWSSRDENSSIQAVSQILPLSVLLYFLSAFDRLLCANVIGLILVWLLPHQIGNSFHLFFVVIFLPALLQIDLFLDIVASFHHKTLIKHYLSVSLLCWMTSASSC